MHIMIHFNTGTVTASPHEWLVFKRLVTVKYADDSCTCTMVFPKASEQSLVKRSGEDLVGIIMQTVK